MLRIERQRRISELVAARGQVTVADLAERFDVSTMTIRRDLQELDARRVLRRTHGGAVPAEGGAIAEPPLLARVEEQAAAKRRIARATIALLRSREMLFLGSGTTTLAVAEEIARSGRPFVVVTNALTIANALAGSPDVELVVIGGFLRTEELSLIGHVAEAALHDIRVDRVIMGMRGIDPDHGLTSDHLAELATDQAIIGTSDNLTVVADPTKFGRIAASRTAPVDAATTIVTTRDAPIDIVERIRSAGVEVHLT